MIKKSKCLPSLNQNVVTLVSIDFNNDASDNDSNIEESKEEELQLSLSTGSDRQVNKADDSDTFTEKASDEPIF